MLYGRTFGNSCASEFGLLGVSCWPKSTPIPFGEFIVIVGRQHPPEVTGSLNLFPFLATVLGDSSLARQFRARYQLIIYPFLNPDGVALGHWRHNTGGVDLNRDWGPFTQPETRLVRDHVDDILLLSEEQIAAFEAAEAEGHGVAVVDGKIVENLHVATAREILAKAEAISALQAG